MENKQDSEVMGYCIAAGAVKAVVVVVFVALMTVVGSTLFGFGPFDLSQHIDVFNFKEIASGEHFLPKYESDGIKQFPDLLSETKDTNRIEFRDGYSVDPKSINKIKKYNVTEIALTADHSKEYTKIEFSTNMDFENDNVNIFGSNLENQSLKSVQKDDNTFRLTRDSKHLHDDLIGLLVTQKGKDVTNKGKLIINQSVIKWDMDKKELEKVNQSDGDDVFIFYVFQTKPKTTIE